MESDETCFFKDSQTQQYDIDQAQWFVSEAFKYENTQMDKLHKLIQDAKSVHPGFMTTPIIGLTLMRSVQMNRKDVIRCLVSEGTSVNMLFRGRTMLHFAVKSDNLSMLAFLLSLDDVDKNKRDVEGFTPLMEAAHGRPDCLKILLQGNCSLHVRDKKGRTAFHHTILNRTILTTHPKREDVIRCLDIFLAHGADINVQDSEGESCLHKAIKTNNCWFMQWLILHNCDLNKGGPKVSLTSGTLPALKILHASPFLMALQWANRIVVEVLIACGCEFRKHYNLLEFSKDYRLLYLSLHRAFTSVDSLQSLSRTVIRQKLSSNIVVESAHLGLPASLQRYILCKEEISLLGNIG